MKIALTGATGFIGRHLLAELVKRGHEISVLVRNPAKVEESHWPSIRTIHFDLDAPNNAATEVGKHDALIHLAWPRLPNYKELFHFEENLPASYRFLKASIEAGVPQVLVAGTCFEYGMQDGCLGENLAARPANSYSLAKDTLRKFLERLREKQPFTLQWIRLFYMYGPGQNSNSLLAQLDRAIDNGDAIFNMSGGEQLRDYLPVEQVASGLARVAEHSKCDGITNVCSGVPISVRKLVEQQIQSRNARIELNFGYYPYPSHEPMAFWGDARKFQAIISSTS
ncbi:NAD(P)-dependent oxidoreductase [Paraburkholderia sp. J8-2]|uniref:NAD-dependent epimerase/dehydratase family protein n=1 Tax=Paraburkholderia sp. J8-2 TaxID=2805440 RepID=UPI002AB7E13C|nr:NAD(P)-dependent oxidoreductase [Paraburkholderia sp. J8-2]